VRGPSFEPACTTFHTSAKKHQSHTRVNERGKNKFKTEISGITWSCITMQNTANQTQQINELNIKI
jgi:hypothetical protein